MFRSVFESVLVLVMEKLKTERQNCDARVNDALSRVCC